MPLSYASSAWKCHTNDACRDIQNGSGAKFGSGANNMRNDRRADCGHDRLQPARRPESRRRYRNNRTITNGALNRRQGWHAGKYPQATGLLLFRRRRSTQLVVDTYTPSQTGSSAPQFNVMTQTNGAASSAPAGVNAALSRKGRSQCQRALPASIPIAHSHPGNSSTRRFKCRILILLSLGIKRN
jgi:hypothetical protein